MKEEILLLTGWGSSCAVWKFIIPALSKSYQVKCLVPSWSNESSISASLKDFDHYIEELADTCKKPIYIVAWSMGGLLAIALAKRYPSLIKKICLVSSVPTFVSDNNEHAGIDFDWFQSFSSQFQQQPLRTLKKFLSLQVYGDEFAKTILRELKDSCQFEDYDLVECGFALELLGTSNYTNEFYNLSCDTIFIHGLQDAVVSVEAAQHAAKISQSSIHLIKNAGHVPHLSHPEQVLDVIIESFDE